ncbi:MAG: energy transducer TonB [Thermoanaerobaculia bacterium]|nr:energy transducer TonB [Thermoanaerobaculia bacterium]
MKIWPLVVVLFVACDGPSRRRLADLPEGARFGIWADRASHEQRRRDLAETAAAAEAEREFDAWVAHLHDNYRFESAELAALDAEAAAKGWRADEACRVPEGTILQHGHILPPLPLERPAPRFTAEACAAGTQGVVIAALDLDRDGRPTAIEILRGLPHGLDEAARVAFASSRWAPALLCGQPVAVRYNVTVEFRLPCPATADADASRTG